MPTSVSASCRETELVSRVGEDEEGEETSYPTHTPAPRHRHRHPPPSPQFPQLYKQAPMHPNPSTLPLPQPYLVPRGHPALQLSMWNESSRSRKEGGRAVRRWPWRERGHNPPQQQSSNLGCIHKVSVDANGFAGVQAVHAANSACTREGQDLGARTSGVQLSVTLHGRTAKGTSHTTQR
jgi:hypothetical protein